jgi:VCBS repeat-containing protein
MPINKAKVSEVSQEKVLNLINDLNSKASASNPVFLNPPVLPNSGIAFVDGNQAKEGVVSRTPIIKKTTSYTLSSLAERDCLIEMNSTLPVNFTIPVDQLLDFPIGGSLDIVQANSGQVTITTSPITLGTFGSGGLENTITFNLAQENLNVEPNQLVTGTGIEPGTLVVSTNGTEVTVDTPFAGQVSGTLAFKVGLVATPGFKLRTKWSSATILKRARNSWLLFGDLEV